MMAIITGRAPPPAQSRVVLQSVYRFIGVLQQESGKGPRLANGAAYCVPDLTSHTLPPWRALLGRPDPFGSRLPHLSAGKSGVCGERVV